MLCNEQLPSVLSRELVARVEGKPEGGHVGPQGQGRRLVISTILARAEFRIQRIALVAIRVTEVQSGLRCMIQFIPGQVIAEQISSIVGEPEVTGAGMEGQADAVTHAAGEYFHATAVCAQAPDLGKAGLVAYVAGCAHRDVQQAVRGESQVLPSMVRLVGQGTRYHDGLRGLAQPVFNIVVTQDAVERPYVKGTRPEFETGGHVQPLCDLVHAVRHIVMIGISHGMDFARLSRTGEHSTLCAEGQLPCVFHVVGKDTDLEARRQLDQFEFFCWAVSRHRGLQDHSQQSSAGREKIAERSF